MTRSRLVTILLAAALLVGAANLGAFAATGGPLLLGKSNTASKTTTLKTTGSKPALSLKSKAGKAPLKVSNTTKVAKLNADLVDGLDADALKTTSRVYDLAVSGATQDYVTFSLPGLAPGRYEASYAVSAGTDGAATAFGCFLIKGAFGDPSVQLSVGALGDTVSGSLWFVGGSGYVDTRAGAHRLVCQRIGGTITTIPASPQYTATISFTRLDTVTTATSSGVGTAAPRGLAP